MAPPNDHGAAETPTPTPKRWRPRSPFDADIGRLAIPALGTLIAEPLYVLADTAIVGRIGTTELAGLALASTVLLSVHWILTFLAYGTTAAVARLVGAGKDQAAAVQAVQGIWLAFALAIPFTIVLRLFDRWILTVLGGQGEALEAALIYLRISLISLPFLVASLAGAGAFNGRQDTKTPLRIAVAGALGNLILELILVQGLGYGIGASALSTVIAQLTVGFVFIGSVIRWARSAGVSLGPNRASIMALSKTGRGLLLRSFALRGAFTLAAAVAAHIGVVELAAHQIATQIWMTLALALDAVAIAGQALTGKLLGAGEALAAKAAAARMIELDVAVAVISGLLIVVFREPLGSMFSPDPLVISATGALIIWIAVMSPLNGYVFALDGILIGAGDMDYLAVTMVIASAGFVVLAAVVAYTGAGLNWLWAAIAAFMLMRAFFLGRRWRSNRWLVLGVQGSS